MFCLGVKLGKHIYENKSTLKIDLPEEFNQVKQGDTLKVYKVTKDSVYIGFYNKANR